MTPSQPPAFAPITWSKDIAQFHVKDNTHSPSNSPIHSYTEIPVHPELVRSLPTDSWMQAFHQSTHKITDPHQQQQRSCTHSLLALISLNQLPHSLTHSCDERTKTDQLTPLGHKGGYRTLLTACTSPSQPAYTGGGSSSSNSSIIVITISISSRSSGGGGGGGLLPLGVGPHEVLVIRLSLSPGGVHPYRVVRLIVIGVDLPRYILAATKKKRAKTRPTHALRKEKRKREGDQKTKTKACRKTWKIERVSSDGLRRRVWALDSRVG